MRKNNATIGLLISVITCTIIIYSIESNYSTTQIIIGFLIYILPSIFITSINSKLTAFLISIISILLGYFSFKYQFLNIWIGVLLALLIGRAINFYKIKIT